MPRIPDAVVRAAAGFGLQMERLRPLARAVGLRLERRARAELAHIHACAGLGRGER